MAELIRSDAEIEAAARAQNPDETRSAERLRHHFEVERELADRLRAATTEERQALYNEVYDELNQRVEDHPMYRRRSTDVRADNVARELMYLAPFIGPDVVALEIGPGDAELSRALATRVARVHALDVSEAIMGLADPAPNLETHVFDGHDIPLPTASVDVAYSNQLIEHLHPDDLPGQLRDIARVLRPGGCYVCLTPNGLTGPWDVSRLFSDTPLGFHLHEYTHGELHRLLVACGFSGTRALLPLGARVRVVPSALVTLLERVLAPRPLRQALLRIGPLRSLMGMVRIVAVR